MIKQKVQLPHFFKTIYFRETENKQIFQNQVSFEEAFLK